MELAFQTKLLRTICEDEICAERHLGPNVAEVLKRRLADLRAAVSIDDLIAGRPRVLEGEEQHLAIDLRDGHGIILCPNHVRNPVSGTGQLDWDRVRRVKILRIERSEND